MLYYIKFDSISMSPSEIFVKAFMCERGYHRWVIGIKEPFKNTYFYWYETKEDFPYLTSKIIK